MSKLTRDIARKQAKRLQSSPVLVPQADDGMTEILDCLQRHCRDGAHAERTMTRLLDSAKNPRNITAEIARCAAETREKQAEPLPDRCASCPPGDRVIVDGPKYSSVGRCGCARGEALKARDAAAWAELTKTRKIDSPEPQSREMPRAGHEHPADADWQRRAAGDRP
jgi:hypothetical protein